MILDPSIAISLRMAPGHIDNNVSPIIYLAGNAPSLVWVRLPLLAFHPPKNFDPEIEDRSGFLSWSVLVLTARDSDSLCMPPVLHTVRRSGRDRFPVAPKRSLSQALFPGLAAEAVESVIRLNGDGLVDWISSFLVVYNAGLDFTSPPGDRPT